MIVLAASPDWRKKFAKLPNVISQGPLGLSVYASAIYTESG